MQMASGLADEIAHLLDAPYALYGYSNGSMNLFYVLLELQRRGLPLPFRLFISARCPPTPGASIGANELAKVEAELRTVQATDDDEMVRIARESAWLPETTYSKTATLAALCRFGNLNSCPLVGNPPAFMTTVPIVEILSNVDGLHPIEKTAGSWAAVTSGGCRTHLLKGVPHEQVKAHVECMQVVFAQLADDLIALAVAETKGA
jgi:surfactin synthase thioesterase subunit